MIKGKRKYLLLALLCAVGIHAQKADSVQQINVGNVYFDKGKLTMESDDKEFKLWFDNRVYIDGAVFMPTEDISNLQSKPNKDLEDDDGQFRFSNGVIVRRARLGIKATLHEKWMAELDIDFAYNEVELKDVFLAYNFNEHVSIKAGNFKEPMSMERISSSRYLMNMERPMVINAFAGGRSIGIAATAWNRYIWASAGVFGEQPSTIQKEKNRGNEGHAFTGRIASAPLNNEFTTLHIGAYGTYRTPDALGAEDRTVEFRTFPETRVDRRRFVRTEVSNVDHYTTTGLELGLRHKKFLAYGEYVYTQVNQSAFDGWYATASYMIVGNNRRYSLSDAEFGPMDVKPGMGNLEFVGRVSYINMNDFQNPEQILTGGQATSYSASLNWYPNQNVLIGLCYMYMNQDKYTDDKGQITVDGKPLKEGMPSGIDFSVAQLRLLISF